MPFNHSSTTQTCHRLVLEGACWDGLKQLFHRCDRPINPAFGIYSKQFKSLWDPTAIHKGSQDPKTLQTLAKHQWWNVKPSLYWIAYSSIHHPRAKSCEIAGFAEAASYKHRRFESPRPWCAHTGQGRWMYFFCRLGPRHLFQQYTNQTMNPKAIQPSVPQSNLHNGRKFVCVSKKTFEWTTPRLQLQATSSKLPNVPPQQSQELQGDSNWTNHCALSTFYVLGRLGHEPLSKLPSAAVLTSANGGLVADAVWTDLSPFKAKEGNPIRILWIFYYFVYI